MDLVSLAILEYAHKHYPHSFKDWKTKNYRVKIKKTIAPIFYLYSKYTKYLTYIMYTKAFLYTFRNERNVG